MNHMIKCTFSRRGGLTNRLPDDMEARLFVAPDGAGIPRPDLQIQRLSWEQRAGDFAGRSGHDRSIAAAAIVRICADAEENLRFLLIEVDESDQNRIIVKRIKVVLGIGEAYAPFLLFFIGRAVVLGLVAALLPSGNGVFFFFRGLVICYHSFLPNALHFTAGEELEKPARMLLRAG